MANTGNIQREIFSDFGSFLKHLRNRSKLTQKDLSEKIGVAKQTLHNWEARRAFPSTAVLRTIANFFQIPFNEVLRIKESHDLQYRRELISNSKDPVVDTIGPLWVPLLDKSVKKLPLDGIKNPVKWSGQKFSLPEDLFPGYVFGFEIQDRSMEPAYYPGDVVLGNVRETVQDGQPVIIKLKNSFPSCRIYFDDGKSLALRTPGVNKGSILKVKRSDIEWCYPVIRRMKREVDQRYGKVISP